MPAESEFHEDYDDNGDVKGYLTLIQNAITDSGVGDNPLVVRTDIPMEPIPDSQGITRIAWPLYANEHKMFYVTKVKQKTVIAARTLKDVFWFIRQGKLSVTAGNAKHNLKEGDWFRLRENTPYSVGTVNECTVVEANKPETNAAYNQYQDRIQHAIGDSGVRDNPIVCMTDIPIEPDTDAQGVQRTPIAWPLRKNGHRMFYIKKVPAGTSIEPHTHDEDVFRYITDGDLTIKIKANPNNDDYDYIYHLWEGNWFRTKQNISYSITTVGGYTVLAAYQTRCATVKDH